MLPYFNYQLSSWFPYSPPCCCTSKCGAIGEVLICIKFWSVGIELFAKALEYIGSGVLGHDVAEVDYAGYVE